MSSVKLSLKAARFIANVCAAVRAPEVAELSAAIVQAERRGDVSPELAAFVAWLDRFEAETRELPVGFEDPVKGASAFNWRISFVREAREALRKASGKAATP